MLPLFVITYQWKNKFTLNIFFSVPIPGIPFPACYHWRPKFEVKLLTPSLPAVLFPRYTHATNAPPCVTITWLQAGSTSEVNNQPPRYPTSDIYCISKPACSPWIYFAPRESHLSRHHRKVLSTCHWLLPNPTRNPRLHLQYNAFWQKSEVAESAAIPLKSLGSHSDRCERISRTAMATGSGRPSSRFRGKQTSVWEERPKGRRAKWHHLV